MESTWGWRRILKAAHRLSSALPCEVSWSLGCATRPVCYIFVFADKTSHLVPSQVVRQNKDYMGRILVSLIRHPIPTFALLSLFLVRAWEKKWEKKRRQKQFHLRAPRSLLTGELARWEWGVSSSTLCSTVCWALGTTAPEVFSISVAQKGQLVGNNRGNGEIFSQ